MLCASVTEERMFSFVGARRTPHTSIAARPAAPSAICYFLHKNQKAGNGCDNLGKIVAQTDFGHSASDCRVNRRCVIVIVAEVPIGLANRTLRFSEGRLPIARWHSAESMDSSWIETSRIFRQLGRFAPEVQVISSLHRSHFGNVDSGNSLEEDMSESDGACAAPRSSRQPVRYVSRLLPW